MRARKLVRLIVLAAAFTSAFFLGPHAARRVVERTGPASPRTDPALLRVLSRADVGARVVSAVAVDIDRDGDLDVLASTPNGFVVLVNDGHDRFSPSPTSDRPRMQSNGPAVAASDSDAANPGTITVAGGWAAPIDRFVVAASLEAASYGADRPAHARSRAHTTRRGRAPPRTALL